MRFEVHAHTEYSNIRLLDCINKVQALIDRAVELGLGGIAITDHESLSAHVKAIKHRDEIIKEHPDFKVALGNEIYLVDERPTDNHYHCILIAKDKIGYDQLKRLSSLAWLNLYGGSRVDTLKSDLKKIVEEDKGHLICTTACIGGELSKKILALETYRRCGNEVAARNTQIEIIDFVTFMKELFSDDFYFEVAPGQSKEQIIVNNKIAQLSEVFGVKMVIGTDAHYLTKEDRYVHKAYLLSKTDKDREVDAFYEYSYLQSENEIIENLTPSIVDLYELMCKNSMEIYDKIENYTLLHSQQIPKVDVKDYPKLASNMIEALREDYPILASMFESNDKVERYWVHECTSQLRRINKDTKEYWQRLEEEADIKKTISKALDTNMFAYPVTLQHYVDLFWECNSTVGAGRGSSCSGLNHYLLGVTQLDPIEWNLPFWRLEL